jgi:hypothetical protein
LQEATGVGSKAGFRVARTGVLVLVLAAAPTLPEPTLSSFTGIEAPALLSGTPVGGVAVNAGQTITLRFDHHTDQITPPMLIEVVKTLAARNGDALPF